MVLPPIGGAVVPPYGTLGHNNHHHNNNHNHNPPFRAPPPLVPPSPPFVPSPRSNSVNQELRSLREKLIAISDTVDALAASHRATVVKTAEKFVALEFAVTDVTTEVVPRMHEALKVQAARAERAEARAADVAAELARANEQARMHAASAHAAEARSRVTSDRLGALETELIDLRKDASNLAEGLRATRNDAAMAARNVGAFAEQQAQSFRSQTEGALRALRRMTREFEETAERGVQGVEGVVRLEIKARLANDLNLRKSVADTRRASETRLRQWLDQASGNFNVLSERLRALESSTSDSPVDASAEMMQRLLDLEARSQRAVEALAGGLESLDEEVRSLRNAVGGGGGGGGASGGGGEGDGGGGVGGGSSAVASLTPRIVDEPPESPAMPRVQSPGSLPLPMAAPPAIASPVSPRQPAQQATDAREGVPLLHLEGVPRAIDNNSIEELDTSSREPTARGGNFVGAILNREVTHEDLVVLEEEREEETRSYNEREQQQKREPHREEEEEVVVVVDEKKRGGGATLDDDDNDDDDEKVIKAGIFLHHSGGGSGGDPQVVNQPSL